MLLGERIDPSRGSLWRRPEDVQIHPAAFSQSVLGEGLETPALFSLATILKIVARHKIIQISPLERAADLLARAFEQGVICP
jgi:hypothetical protein